MLDDRNDTVRDSAVRRLSQLSTTGAAPLFVKALADKNATVRNLAAKSLAKFGGPEHVEELVKLLDMFESAIVPVELQEATPVYDTAGLILAIQSATTEFHTRWDSFLGLKRASSPRTAHWTQIKALNRRIVLDFDNSEYGDLKPVPDFVARLSESMSKYLASPYRWKPRAPSDIEADLSQRS